MVKIVSLLLIKLSCHLFGRKFCSNITFANTVWKTLMILWLDGEILSNYSLLFLSAERLASALDSQHHPRKSYSLAFVFRVVYPIILGTLVIYNLPIGLLLFKVEKDSQAPCGAIMAIERNSALLNRLSILTKFLTFTAPVIGTLFLSYLLLKKIQKWQSQFNRRSKQDEANQLLKIAKYSLFWIWFVFFLYLPLIIYWCSIDIISEFSFSIRVEQLYFILFTLGSYLLALTGLAHVGNLFVYFSFIPSFKVQFFQSCTIASSCLSIHQE